MQYTYCKGFCLHMAARMCHTPKGSIELTYDEMFILWFIMLQRNTLVTPEQIRSIINQPTVSDAQIKRLIDSLNYRLTQPSNARYKGLIMTVPRTGYMIFDANPPEA